MQEKYDDLYKSKNQANKVIIIGDSSVGKTNLVFKFAKGNTHPTKNIQPTIGVEFTTKIVALQDGSRVKAQVWDTAGQEQYRSITLAHYRRAFGALIVYDITKQKTFQNVKRWLYSIRQHADENVVVMLVGNKTDLKDRQVVNTSQAKKLAKEQGLLFEETSALTSDNVDAMFMTLLEEVQKRRKEVQVKEVPDGFRVGDPFSHSKNQKCQC